MEAVLYWQCTAVIYVLLQKMARVLEVFFFCFKTREKMVYCFPSLEIPMRCVCPGLFVEDISTHTERISTYPPPFIVNQSRRDGAMCAHLKKLLLFISIPHCMLAFAICFTAGLENVVHSLNC